MQRIKEDNFCKSLAFIVLFIIFVRSRIVIENIQANNYMMPDTIHTVVDTILKGHNIKAWWKEFDAKEVDGIIELDYKGKKDRFYVDIKKELRNFQLPQILQNAKLYNPFMVVAENIFPNLKAELAKNEIAFIDLKGNIFIETGNIYIKVEGQRDLLVYKERPARTFTKAGLKAIFYFLMNEDAINKTYREIAKEAGIALGNINNIIKGLLDEGFAIRLTDKKYKLTNKNKLLERWLLGYEERLKPALHIGNFRFVKQDDFLKWKNLELLKNDTFWGGEAAANVITNYLNPEILTLYTTEAKADLMKKYKLIPDPAGNVKAYQKFWILNYGNTNAVPPLLAYTDLMNTGDSRCIETANMIYNEHLENKYR